VINNDMNQIFHKILPNIYFCISRQDASKFSIDESNGLLYPSAVFSPNVDTWESEYLGPDMVYEVKVRVTDDLCDQSDEAFMSIAFRCAKPS
jgi:hypothetical protein